jgi:hypothetical protein
VPDTGGHESADYALACTKVQFPAPFIRLTLQRILFGSAEGSV